MRFLLVVLASWTREDGTNLNVACKILSESVENEDIRKEMYVMQKLSDKYLVKLLAFGKFTRRVSNFSHRALIVL